MAELRVQAQMETKEAGGTKLIYEVWARPRIALGRTAEGDAILTQIAGRKWHVRWEGIAYQAKNMLERGKQQVAPNIDE